MYYILLLLLLCYIIYYIIILTKSYIILLYFKLKSLLSSFNLSVPFRILFPKHCIINVLYRQMNFQFILIQTVDCSHRYCFK